MDEDRIALLTGALVHDLGKVALRAGAGEKRLDHSALGKSQLETITESWSHSKEMLECIQYHHAKYLSSVNLRPDHPAWIVCEADNIAAGADRRTKPSEGDSDFGMSSYKMDKCLDNIFNLVRTARNNQDTRQVYRLIYGLQEETEWISPQPDSINCSASQSEYAQIWAGIIHSLGAIKWGDPSYLNSLYGILEGYLSYVPSSTDTRQTADISLFDHSSLTAAIASCIHDWASERGMTDYRPIFTDPQAFRSQEVFLIAHGDLSGIQDFIYTISSKRALKSLRGRSLYLELLIEQMADEILDQLELTRANLLYSGGGGFYLLLPNTKKVQDLLTIARRKYNQWMLSHFSIDLFFGLAWSPASALHFMEEGTSNKETTADVFKSVAQQLSIQKLQRFSDIEPEVIFSPVKPEQGDRECTVCGRSSELDNIAGSDDSGDRNVCHTCRGLIQLGSKVIEDTTAPPEQKIQFLITSERPTMGLRLSLPSLDDTAWLTLSNTDELRRRLQLSPLSIKRIYSKNHYSSGLEFSTRIWVADYNYCVLTKSGAVEFKDFVDMRGDEGIGRVAVLRADVDNLGSLFAGGFRANAPDKTIYETLGRYATLSRSLSRFFKSHINHIADEKKRNIVLVYAGGDDIFAVGAWDEVLDFALDLRDRFQIFTAGKLSLSAGIGFFRHDFPISQMAERTGELEHAAKTGPKDQIALFGIQSKDGVSECKHVFGWDRFRDGVLPKRDFLLTYLKSGNRDDHSESTGKAFLYKVLELLLTADYKLSLARLAYLIARKEPSDSASSEMTKQYQDLRNNLYQWATNPDERQELVTAIMLSIYVVRKRGD